MFSCSALICLKNAPNIPAKNFHALTRLDENRAKCQVNRVYELHIIHIAVKEILIRFSVSAHFYAQLALKAGVFYDKVSNMTIWGNHSTTQVIEELFLEDMFFSVIKFYP